MAIAAIPIDTLGPFGPFALARIGRGGLALGHRPRLRSLDRLAGYGITHVATVLSAAENPGAVGDAARDAGLGWLWLPLGATKSLPKRAKPEIRAYLTELSEVLDGGGRVYLHCSAGIHRTGMIAAALLFHRGCPMEEVRRVVGALRPITGDDMGQARFEWASSFDLQPGSE